MTILVPDDAQSPLADFLAQLGWPEPNEAVLQLAASAPRGAHGNIGPRTEVFSQSEEQVWRNLEASAVASVVWNGQMTVNVLAVGVHGQEPSLSTNQLESVG